MAAIRLWVLTFSLSMASSRPGLNLTHSMDSGLVDNTDTDVVGLVPVTASLLLLQSLLLLLLLSLLLLY